METVENLLARHAKACELRHPFDKARAVECMKAWVLAIGGPQCRVMVVADAASVASAVSVVRAAWDARDASAAWAAWDAWAASAARAARDASAAWDASAARDAWAARAAWNAWNASAARDAWNASVARDAWAAWNASYMAIISIGASQLSDESTTNSWMPLFQAFEAGVHLFWVGEDEIWIAPPPTLILTDDTRRLHCETGPAFSWLSDVHLHFVHGVLVPAQVIEAPDTMTGAQIEAEANAEVRRVMIERFGADRYMRDAGAIVIDHDERWGTLWRKPRAGDSDMLMLEVVNRSPEPDGSFRHYWLRIQPECRPMPTKSGMKLGAPQPLTALNAVASTFGKRGKEYMSLEAES